MPARSRHVNELLAARTAVATAAACAFALSLAPFPPPAALRPAPVAGLQLADMGMGSWGPQLGGDSDDMILTDPGHEPAAASDMQVDSPGRYQGGSPGFVTNQGQYLAPASDMQVDTPGFVPQQPNMDVQPQQDLDRDDYMD